MKTTTLKVTTKTTRMNSHTPHRAGRLRAAVLCSLLVLPAAALLANAAPSAFAQHKKDPTQRLIEGTVTDKGSKPLPGAVVYLKDAKTLALKSYLADDTGHFRFAQLSLDTDYELWATMNGKHSKTRSISSFNSKPTLDYTLKLGTEAEDAVPANSSNAAAGTGAGAAPPSPATAPPTVKPAPASADPTSTASTTPPG